MAFATTPRGRVLVDRGALRAIRDDGKSVLAAGVTGVEGSFTAGDAVEVAGPDGIVFARGISRYSDRELCTFVNPTIFPVVRRGKGGWIDEVIHRDELVGTIGYKRIRV